MTVHALKGVHKLWSLVLKLPVKKTLSLHYRSIDFLINRHIVLHFFEFIYSDV